jgi:hypothetical protein
LNEFLLFSGIWDFDPDYMHAIALNVLHRWMDLLWNPLYANRQFSLYSYIQSINEWLQQVQTPHSKSRPFRHLDNDYIHWKAAELRDWFIYLAPLVLFSIMTQEYWEHFLAFHEAFTIFMKPISKDRIELAKDNVTINYNIMIVISFIDGLLVS